MSQPALTDSQDEQQRCGRGGHCTSPEINPDGERRPALTYQAFCTSDRDAVGRAIRALPGLFADLAQTLGERRRGDGPRVSGSQPAPPLPINLAVDARIRETILIVSSWDERVRTVARLSGPDTEASRHRRDQPALARMASTLAAHLDALLALPAEPMMRAVTLEQAALHAVAGRLGVVHVSGEWAEVILDLAGVDAGLELLALERRCLHLLGWTPQHEDLPVACWDCSLKTVRRRDGAAGLEDRASCSGCGALYEDERYRLLMGEVYDQRVARGSSVAVIRR